MHVEVNHIHLRAEHGIWCAPSPTLEANQHYILSCNSVAIALAVIRIQD